jgi:hypothetical protein
MKFRIPILLLILSALSVSMWAQCSNPGLKPVWDTDRSQFRCADPNHPGASAKDESVQPTGNKEACASARQNLEAACPQSNDGKACRNQAKSIYNACYKRAKNDSDGQGLPGSASSATLESCRRRLPVSRILRIRVCRMLWRRRTSAWQTVARIRGTVKQNYF